MKLEISDRDGYARIGLFSIDNTTFQIPNFLQIEHTQSKKPSITPINTTNFTDSKKPPILHIGKNIFFTQSQQGFSDLSLDTFISLPPDLPVESYQLAKTLVSQNTAIQLIPPDVAFIQQQKFDKNLGVAIIPYASQLLSRQTYFSKVLSILRDHLYPHTLLYFPAVATPANLALLIYFGIDVFDLNKAAFAALHEIFLFPEGAYHKNSLEKNPCLCPVCLSNDIDEMTISNITAHNAYVLWAELAHIHNAIHHGRLRELVEIRVRSNPQLAALLHIMDISQYNFLEKATPLFRKNGIVATTSDALWRPEIQRFQKRIISWYEKPESSKILLLLPCSAKKPYSRSKSHRRIHAYIRNVRNFYTIHELIVTSPLGIVPRDLENIYPASSYDISVTGLWTKDEQHMIRSLLVSFLKRNSYDHMILHLPQTMQDFLSDIHPNCSSTCSDSPTHEESLQKLIEIVSDISTDYPLVSREQYCWERVKSLASFQFGPDIADKLLKGSMVKGRGPQFKIFKNSHQLGMITHPRGYISLTIKGADILRQAQQYWVEIDTSFQLKGSVFAPGVLNADSRIRIGDEVCIIQNNTVEGVGVAQMPGSEMITAQYGEAVKLRHHASI